MFVTGCTCPSPNANITAKMQDAEHRVIGWHYLAEIATKLQLVHKKLSSSIVSVKELFEAVRAEIESLRSKLKERNEYLPSWDAQRPKSSKLKILLHMQLHNFTTERRND